MTYPIFKFSLSDCHGVEPESQGTKDKCWLVAPCVSNETVLFKKSRENTGEHWSEKCAAELCVLLGIPHAGYDIAVCDGEWGVVSYDIVPAGAQLKVGSDVLPAYDRVYEAAQRLPKSYTVEKCLGCLDLLMHDDRSEWGGEDAGMLFTQYLFLDALVGNQDRHHENWAVLEYPAKAWMMAPTYDHAASLGRELTDENRKLRIASKDAGFQVEAFVGKAKSKFYDSHTGKLQTTLEALMAVLGLRPQYRQMCRTLVEKLEAAAIDRIFNDVPAECITDAAREFSMRMVKANVERMKKYV